MCDRHSTSRVTVTDVNRDRITHMIDESVLEMILVFMAALLRSARSGGDWTSNDLLAYNIVVTSIKDDAAFFGRPLVPENSFDPLLLSNATNPDQLIQLQSDIGEFLTLLNCATTFNPEQESAIDDFIRSLLHVLGYFTSGRTVIRSRFAIPFLICGDSQRLAQTDIAVLHTTSMVLLLIQEDKTRINRDDPEPQLIAEAIAAFQYNNKKRKYFDLPTLETMTIPAVTVVGTQPTFYLVPVTEELSRCVAAGIYPQHQTEVRCCRPPLRGLGLGMEDVEYRRVALQYYATFLLLAREFWPLMTHGLIVGLSKYPRNVNSLLWKNYPGPVE
jgi:hypothetical protein